ncbi:MAG: peptidoglycan bridge formation glycyltransferase FemA/FemB family protein, partial [Pyrinomonadaceae bacterium]
IRLSERRGVTTKVVNGETIAENVNYLDEFYTMYHQNCQRIVIKSMSRKSIETFVKTLRENLFVLYAYVNSGELGAVTLFIVNGDTIWYESNGSTAKGRNNFATNLLVWKGILEGKRRGCRWFDFDGVCDERYPKLDEDWKGFTRFKVGFGGEEVMYLGTYNKWIPFLKKSRRV